MPAAVLNRTAALAGTLFGVAMVAFVLLRMAPGDPIAMMIGPGASVQDIAALRAAPAINAAEGFLGFD